MSEGNQRGEDAGAAAPGAPSPGSADPTTPFGWEEEDEEGAEEDAEEEGGDDDAEEEGVGSGGGEDASAGSIRDDQTASTSSGTTSTPRGDSLESLLGARKLILVLDLDHTLLNSTAFDDLSSTERRNGFTADDPSRGLFWLDSPSTIGVLTKLRPFVHGFLEEARAMFQMHVYTLGNRYYARACANLLDPDGAYFGGGTRIISRDDARRTDRKSLDLVVPAGERVGVVILDDTEDVWEEHRDNLILVNRYCYFASAFQTLGLGGGGGWRSLAEQRRDEGERDGALATTLDVLRRVHREFFGSVSGGVFSDVRVVLRELRRQVLPGCTVAFSRVIPAGVPAEGHPVWRMAEQLGAVCETDAGATVTHVVAMVRSTEMARWAVQNGRFLVHPSWLHAAYFSWRRPDEHRFPVIRGRP